MTFITMLHDGMNTNSTMGKPHRKIRDRLTLKAGAASTAAPRTVPNVQNVTLKGRTKCQSMRLLFQGWNVNVNRSKSNSGSRGKCSRTRKIYDAFEAVQQANRQPVALRDFASPCVVNADALGSGIFHGHRYYGCEVFQLG